MIFMAIEPDFILARSSNIHANRQMLEDLDLLVLLLGEVVSIDNYQLEALHA